MFHVVQSGSEFCISATMRENSARSAPLVWSVFTTVGTLTCVVASYCGFTRISLMTDDFDAFTCNLYGLLTDVSVQIFYPLLKFSFGVFFW